MKPKVCEHGVLGRSCSVCEWRDEALELRAKQEQLLELPYLLFTSPLLGRAVQQWGAAAQWRMVQEECGELVAAVNRFDRRRCSAEALAEEVADVLIMSAQARMMLGERLVDIAVENKLERLYLRLSKSESKP